MSRPSLDESTSTVEDFENLLRKREMEVLCLRCEGLTTKQIAVKLGITEFTTRNYLTAIFNKTGIRSSSLICQRFRVSEQRTKWYSREIVKRGARSEIVVSGEGYRSVIMNRE